MVCRGELRTHGVNFYLFLFLVFKIHFLNKRVLWNPFNVHIWTFCQVDKLLVTKMTAMKIFIKIIKVRAFSYFGLTEWNFHTWTLFLNPYDKQINTIFFSSYRFFKHKARESGQLFCRYRDQSSSPDSSFSLPAVKPHG